MICRGGRAWRGAAVGLAVGCSAVMRPSSLTAQASGRARRAGGPVRAQRDRPRAARAACARASATTAASPVPATAAPTSQAARWPRAAARRGARPSACPGGRAGSVDGQRTTAASTQPVAARSGTPSSAAASARAHVDRGRRPAGRRARRPAPVRQPQHVPARPGGLRQPLPLRGRVGQRLGADAAAPRRRPARRCRAAPRPAAGRRRPACTSSDVAAPRAASSATARAGTPAPAARRAPRRRHGEQRPGPRCSDPGRHRPARPSRRPHRRSAATPVPVGRRRRPRESQSASGGRDPVQAAGQAGDRRPGPLAAGPRRRGRRGVSEPVRTAASSSAGAHRAQLQGVRIGARRRRRRPARPAGRAPGGPSGSGRPDPASAPGRGETRPGSSTVQRCARTAPAVPITRRTSAAQGWPGMPSNAAGGQRRGAARRAAPRRRAGSARRPGRLQAEVVDQVGDGRRRGRERLGTGVQSQPGDPVRATPRRRHDRRPPAPPAGRPARPGPSATTRPATPPPITTQSACSGASCRRSPRVRLGRSRARTPRAGSARRGRCPAAPRDRG